MENAMTGRVRAALAREQSAVRNASSAADKIKLVIVWLAVGLPLIWGVMKALENIGSLPF
jgi:hypothetical protein